MLSTQYLLIVAMAATSAYATQFIGYTDTKCNAGAVEITTNDHSGSCNEIGATGSVAAQKVDSGCTISIYTDSVCTANPTVAGLGQCVEVTNGYFFSYSVDC